MSPELDGGVRILIAALGAAAIGIERQRSGRATGPQAHFAGVRTMTLLGGFSGVAGVLWSSGYPFFGGALLIGALALVAIAYLAISDRDVDATTEVAALIVVAAGLLSGLAQVTLASALFAGTALLLLEKTRLHALIHKIPGTGLLAGARFAVLALIVLPLLPEGPFGPWGGVRPRELWMLVLFFSSLSFAGYVARTVAGESKGYVLTGFLGGLVSSTNVTLTFSRLSRTESALAAPLALGVTAACTVMYFRVAAAMLVLNPQLAAALIPFLAPPAMVGIALTVMGLRRAQPQAVDSAQPANPLALGAALQMAALFQLVLFGLYFARERWGGAGLVLSGAVLGLTDVDALTFSMARQAANQDQFQAATLAVAAGVLANGLLKLAVAAIVGFGPFRRYAAAGLALLAIASAVVLFFRL